MAVAVPAHAVDPYRLPPLTADQHQQLFRAALPAGGRSVTLYEEIHPVKKLGKRRIQQRFLSSLQALLPAHVTI